METEDGKVNSYSSNDLLFRKAETSSFREMMCALLSGVNRNCNCKIFEKQSISF